MSRLRWASKVSQRKIWQLYQTDARGLIDEELINDVGFALYDRCQSIIMVTQARQVICPQCAQTIHCPGKRWSRALPPICSSCDWQFSYGQWRHSWRHQDLQGGNAMDAFRAFVASFPAAKTPRWRMFLIDRLIHTFHWSQRRQRHHGPAATQLISGQPDDVLVFLDKLTFGK